MNLAKKAVVLMNMGGPDSLTDVEPFLYNLFSDREIIKLGPIFLQKFLAKIISRRRAPKSRSIYQKIGGGSPLRAITEKQALALQDALTAHGNYHVSVAMRYWPPFAESVLKSLKTMEIEEVIALTLYPHFSRATTGSSINNFQDRLNKLCPQLPLKIISSWPTEPSYVKAVAENINRGLTQFDGEKATVVYSAHSLPTSFIADGDPYVEHINQTIEAVEKLTGKAGELCYQSRSGPVEWLSPSTSEMLSNLAEAGKKNILMVPISFVSDHVETLYEIGMLYRDEAHKQGMKLIPCESLNTQPLFINGLRDLVLNVS